MLVAGTTFVLPPRLLPHDMLDEYVFVARAKNQWSKNNYRGLVVVSYSMVVASEVHCARMAVGNISRVSSLSASLAMVVG